MKLLNLITNTSKKINRIACKIDYLLQQQQQKIANKEFNKNQYIQDYIKTFYNSFKYSVIGEDNTIYRINPFNWEEANISEELEANLKDYMQDFHGLYYYEDDYSSGFSICTFDNIYLSYERDIYANFLPRYTEIKLSYKYDFELFLKLEKIQADSGIYPDIVYCGYYGEYSDDYTIPDKYRFLLYKPTTDEKKRQQLIEELIRIYDTDYSGYSFTDNFIINDLTPTFIKKINNNLEITISDIGLADNLDISIQYEIPTVLTQADLLKLNITDFKYTRYNTTLITLKLNIEAYLLNKLATYHTEAA